MNAVAGFYDDGSCTIFDIPTGEIVKDEKMHSERIQTIARKDNLTATGSYDKKIKIWKGESFDECVKEFEHGYAVESICWVGNGNILASAGGGLVKIWDLADSSEKTVSAWAKTVTCLVYDANTGLIFCGSSDCSIRTVDPITLKVEKFQTASAPVLSINFSGHDTLLVGLFSGQIEIYRNIPKVDAGDYRPAEDIKKKIKSDRSKRYAHSKKVMSKHFRKFHFRMAFTYSLQRSLNYDQNTLEPFIDCLFELERLKALSQAMSSQPDKIISELLKYINLFIFDLKSQEELQHSCVNSSSIVPLFSKIVQTLMELGYCQQSSYPRSFRQFQILRNRIKLETKTIKALNKTSGVLSMFVRNLA